MGNWLGLALVRPTVGAQCEPGFPIMHPGWDLRHFLRMPMMPTATTLLGNIVGPPSQAPPGTTYPPAAYSTTVLPGLPYVVAPQAGCRDYEYDCVGSSSTFISVRWHSFFS
jgi:hypothetical protein